METTCTAVCISRAQRARGASPAEPRFGDLPSHVARRVAQAGGEQPRKRLSGAGGPHRGRQGAPKQRLTRGRGGDGLGQGAPRRRVSRRRCGRVQATGETVQQARGELSDQLSPRALVAVLRPEAGAAAWGLRARKEGA